MIEITNAGIELEGLGPFHYLDAGSGEPILFVPGWTMTAEIFRAQVTHFAHDHRVLVLEPRSHGQSVETLDGNTCVEIAKDIRAFIAAMELEGVVLVTWSNAVHYGYAYLGDGIGRVRAFVAIDSPPCSMRRDKADAWFDGDREELIELWPARFVKDRSAWFREFVQTIVARPLEARELEWFLGMHYSTPMHAAVQLWLSGSLMDSRDLVRRLDRELPMLNVVRREVLSEASAWLAANAPGTAVGEMVSHAGFWEDPATFNELLGRFIQSLGP